MLPPPWKSISSAAIRRRLDHQLSRDDHGRPPPPRTGIDPIFRLVRPSQQETIIRAVCQFGIVCRTNTVTPRLVEPRISIRGTEASSVSYAFAFWDLGKGPVVMAFGRHKDVLVKCADGRWRIRQRRVENECNLSAETLKACSRLQDPAPSKLFELPEAVARRQELATLRDSATE